MAPSTLPRSLPHPDPLAKSRQGIQPELRHGSFRPRVGRAEIAERAAHAEAHHPDQILLQPVAPRRWARPRPLSRSYPVEDTWRGLETTATRGRTGRDHNRL